MKKIEDVTEDDQELMTTEEYEVGSGPFLAGVCANWDRGIRTSHVWLREEGSFSTINCISDSIKLRPCVHS